MSQNGIHNKIPDKGDPSNVLQLFQRYNLQVLCCRYWWLQKWEFKELSFPYWRIYHNQNEGAVIIYREKEIALGPNKIIMIAPNTSYATRLFDHVTPGSGYSLIGHRITEDSSEAELLDSNKILHLFIHFNLGIPYDNVSPGIFCYEITNHLLKKIETIKSYLLQEYQSISFYAGITIQALISDLLSNLPESSWNLKSKDSRVQNSLNYIENNLSSNLSNPILAERTRMAVNSFTRIFTLDIGMSPQKYVQSKRVDQACILLHHSDLTIDEIAVRTGFYDRFQFSKMFRKWTGTSPAKYKKDFSMKA